jgi:23S rRNA pseudouridine1911/1915/1917 synthase
VSAGEVVELARGVLIPPGLEDGSPVPQDIPLRVVHLDDDIVVINKDAGLVVHPAHGNWDGTVVNALLGLGISVSDLGLPERPGIVHRLDKDTSGLMVVARTDHAYRHLSEELKAHNFHKEYHALTLGNIGVRSSTVDAPIARHPVKRQQMAVVEGSGKPARSDLFVVDSYRHFDYIRLTTYTGRTHQIRVHLAHIGHPILGDPVYGGRKLRGQTSHARFKTTLDMLLRTLSRHALHASKLSFVHPGSKEKVTFATALPGDMRAALEIIHREDRTKEVTG